jgi:hypothetical protein
MPPDSYCPSKRAGGFSRLVHKKYFTANESGQKILPPLRLANAQKNYRPSGVSVWRIEMGDTGGSEIIAFQSAPNAPPVR